MSLISDLKWFFVDQYTLYGGGGGGGKGGGGKGPIQPILQIAVPVIAVAASVVASPIVGAAIMETAGIEGAAAATVNAVGAAAVGASESAVITAANGGTPDQIASSAAIGLASGAVGASASTVAGVIAPSIGTDAASIVANSAVGATRAAISGGDPLAGAAGGAVGTLGVEAGLPTAAAGAIGGGTQAAISGKDVATSALTSGLANIAGEAFKPTPTTTTTADGTTQYAPLASATTSDVPQPAVPTGTVTVEQVSPKLTDGAGNTYVDNGSGTYYQYDPNGNLINTQASLPSDATYQTQAPDTTGSSASGYTPNPTIDTSVFNMMQKQYNTPTSTSGGGTSSMGTTGSGSTQTLGSGTLGGPSGTGGGGGYGTGPGGGGGTGGDQGASTDGYTKAPFMTTISSLLGGKTQTLGGGTSSPQGTSTTSGGGFSTIDPLSSVLLGSNPAVNPAQATGEPSMLGDGKRKDVWNLESLRGALGV